MVGYFKYIYTLDLVGYIYLSLIDISYYPSFLSLFYLFCGSLLAKSITARSFLYKLCILFTKRYIRAKDRRRRSSMQSSCKIANVKESKRVQKPCFRHDRHGQITSKVVISGYDKNSYHNHRIKNSDFCNIFCNLQTLNDLQNMLIFLGLYKVFNQKPCFCSIWPCTKSIVKFNRNDPTRPMVFQYYEGKS